MSRYVEVSTAQPVRPAENSRPGDRRKRPTGISISRINSAAATLLRLLANSADRGTWLATINQVVRTAERHTPVTAPVRSTGLRDHRCPGCWETGIALTSFYDLPFGPNLTAQAAGVRPKQGRSEGFRCQRGQQRKNDRDSEARG